MSSKFRKIARAVICTLLSVSGAATYADTSADGTSFYIYAGKEPLATFKPGDVLNTRELNYKPTDLSPTFKATQILYRTKNAAGNPSANTTTVIKDPDKFNGNYISYQSAYDSLSENFGPSRVISGESKIATITDLFLSKFNPDGLVISALLKDGYGVIVPDVEGPTANFAIGEEYGMTTLDSIRAAVKTSSLNITKDTKIALVGYSGGAIATNWAAQLAPDYAPDVNKMLVGASSGGVMVNPVNNLKYVDGSHFWGAASITALAGIARGYDYDVTPYLNDYGLTVYKDIQKQSLLPILSKYPGLRWSTLFKEGYTNGPESLPDFAKHVNKLNLGLRPSPTIPIFMAQGRGLDLIVTPQTGDGVMVAYDVRALAKKYCSSNVPVSYREYLADHVGAVALWWFESSSWLANRFKPDETAPSDCSWISLLRSNSFAEVPTK